MEELPLTFLLYLVKQTWFDSQAKLYKLSLSLIASLFTGENLAAKSVLKGYLFFCEAVLDTII